MVVEDTWMFQTNYLGLKMGDPFFEEAAFCYLKKGMNSECIREVSNQGATDTCYAFAATASIYADSVLKRANGNPLNGSCQEYMDCLHELFPPKSSWPNVVKPPPRGLPNTFGHTFDYAKEFGLYFSSDYPFKACVSTCQETLLGQRGCSSPCPCPSDRKIFIRDHRRCPVKDVIKHLEKQPLVGKILINHEFTQWEGEGIFPGVSEVEMKEYAMYLMSVKDRRKYFPRKKKRIDSSILSPKCAFHAVLLVGHGVKNRIKYFVCQNSQGVEWGHNGYFKIPQDKVSQVWYPTDAKLRVLGKNRKRRMARKIKHIYREQDENIQNEDQEF